jgi:hypothetical protein
LEKKKQKIIKLKINQNNFLDDINKL